MAEAQAPLVRSRQWLYNHSPAGLARRRRYNKTQKQKKHRERWNNSTKGRVAKYRYRHGHRAKVSDAGRSRSALKRGAAWADKTVCLLGVYERDEGTCWLCLHDVPHPDNQEVDIRARASIDHVIPVVKGGPHCWTNVRLAHVGCNCTRRDREVAWAQERLQQQASDGRRLQCGGSS